MILKKSAKKPLIRSVKKNSTLRLFIHTSCSSSSTSKTASYTEDENEYNPNFEYDTWELTAITQKKEEYNIRRFFAERQERQKVSTPSILELVLEDPPRSPGDSISPRKEREMSLQNHLFSRQDSIIVSRTRIKERRNVSKSSVNTGGYCFSLPSSPRKSSTEIHNFQLSSSVDESSDYEPLTKLTFSDSSIVRPKEVPKIGRSRSHRFKKKKWHSNLKFTSIHSPRKRRNTYSAENNT